MEYFDQFREFWPNGALMPLFEIRAAGPPIETNRLGIGASLLVGLLCGLAERGIANAVSSRATIFAKSLGG